MDKGKLNRKYEYFAFISYKREDEKWAKWLQKKLEYYKLPSSVRKDNPELPEKIRPVFKDTTDLEPGILPLKIQEALESSKFLIVICSPRSANSVWVSKEVQSFIDSGRADNIIPFIIEGTPNALDPKEECFPEGLRQLSGEQELLGANINEMGRDAAAIKVIARMFNLRFDTLWQRTRKERKKMYIRLAIFISIFIIILLCLSISLWHSNNKIKKELSNVIGMEVEKCLDANDLSKGLELCYSAQQRDLNKGEKFIKVIQRFETFPWFVTYLNSVDSLVRYQDFRVLNTITPTEAGELLQFSILGNCVLTYLKKDNRLKKLDYKIISVSPNGKFGVKEIKDDNIAIIELATEKIVHEVRVQNVFNATVLNNGYFITITLDKKVGVFNAKGEEVCAFQLPFYFSQPREVFSKNYKFFPFEYYTYLSDGYNCIRLHFPFYKKTPIYSCDTLSIISQSPSLLGKMAFTPSGERGIVLANNFLYKIGYKGVEAMYNMKDTLYNCVYSIRDSIFYLGSVNKIMAYDPKINRIISKQEGLNGISCMAYDNVSKSVLLGCNNKIATLVDNPVFYKTFSICNSPNKSVGKIIRAFHHPSKPLIFVIDFYNQIFMIDYLEGNKKSYYIGTSSENTKEISFLDNDKIVWNVGKSLIFYNITGHKREKELKFNSEIYDFGYVKRKNEYKFLVATKKSIIYYDEIKKEIINSKLNIGKIKKIKLAKDNKTMRFFGLEAKGNLLTIYPTQLQFDTLCYLGAMDFCWSYDGLNIKEINGKSYLKYSSDLNTLMGDLSDEKKSSSFYYLPNNELVEYDGDNNKIIIKTSDGSSILHQFWIPSDLTWKRGLQNIDLQVFAFFDNTYFFFSDNEIIGIKIPKETNIQNMIKEFGQPITNY